MKKNVICIVIVLIALALGFIGGESYHKIAPLGQYVDTTAVDTLLVDTVELANSDTTELMVADTLTIE